MFNSFKYTHLVTKIRAMQGKMLTNEDYDQLLKMQTVKDIATYLKNNTYYKKNFEDLVDQDIHRGQLEILLNRALISDALKIARYLKGAEKTIYRFVYRKQEIEDLKKMLRALQMGRNLEELDRRSLFISHYSNIDFNKALKAKNVKELVELLADTNFYPILSPLLLSDVKINLFAAEMGLDLYYYNQVHDQIHKKMSGKDHALMHMSFGLDADFRNMMWIYRSKKYYNMQKEIIYSYIIPNGHKLKKADIIELVEAPSPEALMQMLKKGPYGEIVDFESGHWDNSFNQFYGNKQLRNMRLLPFTIAPIIGYIFIKEIEILNLTTIIEGVRYKVDPKKVETYLARQNI